MEAYNSTGYYEYHPPLIEYSKDLVPISIFTHKPRTPQEIRSYQNSVLFEELFKIKDIFGPNFKFIDYCDFMKRGEKHALRMIGVEIESKTNNASADLFIYYNYIKKKPCLRIMNQWGIYEKMVECMIKGHNIVFHPSYIKGDWIILGYTRLINGVLINPNLC